MIDHGYCTIFLRNTMVADELMNIFIRNLDKSSGKYTLPLTFRYKKRTRTETQEIVDKFVSEVGLYDLLTPEEELILIKQVAEGDDDAFERIMLSNSRFVVSLSNQYQHRGIALPELFDIAIAGLHEAVTHSAAKPLAQRLIEFAMPYMRKAIETALTMPEQYTPKSSEIRAVSELIELTYGADFILIRVRFEGFPSVCSYLRYRGVKFIYNIYGQQFGYGGYTNDTHGEFFNCNVHLDWAGGDETEIEIPITSTEDDINAIIAEQENNRGEKATMSYALRYRPDEFLDLNNEERLQMEQQIALLAKDYVIGELNTTDDLGVWWNNESEESDEEDFAFDF